MRQLVHERQLDRPADKLALCTEFCTEFLVCYGMICCVMNRVSAAAGASPYWLQLPVIPMRVERRQHATSSARQYAGMGAQFVLTSILTTSLHPHS